MKLQPAVYNSWLFLAHSVHVSGVWLSGSIYIYSNWLTRGQHPLQPAIVSDWSVQRLSTLVRRAIWPEKLLVVFQARQPCSIYIFCRCLGDNVWKWLFKQLHVCVLCVQLEGLENELKCVRETGAGRVYQPLPLPEGMALSSSDVIASFNEHLIVALQVLFFSTCLW